MIKILTIGNSFSDDTMEYVGHIAKSLGIEVFLGNLYIGGCSINTHANNLIGDTPAYEFRTFINGEWITQYGYKLADALQLKDWDYVCFQQVSHQSGLESTFERLDELVLGVRAIVGNRATFIWNMTWAYQSDSAHTGFLNYNNDQQTMYSAIIQQVKNVILCRDEFKVIIPVGTAIQNARTSILGDNLTRDGFHLNTQYGRYIASLTFLGALTKADLSGVTYAPQGVSQSIKNVCIECAVNAITKPFEVTKSVFI